jgi:hypothetical protein
MQQDLAGGAVLTTAIALVSIKGCGADNGGSTFRSEFTHIPKPRDMCRR